MRNEDDNRPILVDDPDLEAVLGTIREGAIGPECIRIADMPDHAAARKSLEKAAEILGDAPVYGPSAKMWEAVKHLADAIDKLAPE